MKHAVAQTRAAYAALIILVCALLPFQASDAAVKAYTVYDYAQPVDAVAPYNDAFVVASGDELWIAMPDGQTKRLPALLDDNASLQHLLNDADGRLLALAQTSDAYDVYLLDIDEMTCEPAYQIATRGVPAGYIRRVLMQGGYIVIEHQSDMPLKSDMLIYDTTSGGVDILRGYDIMNIAAFRGSEIIGCQRRFDTGAACAIIAVDLATKAQRTLFTAAAVPEALCYDSAKGQIITFNAPSASVMSMSGELLGQRYLPCTDDAYTRLCAINNARMLAVSDGGRLLGAALDEAQDILPVQITGFSADRDETKRFRISHPEIPVATNNMGYRLTPAAVSQRIQGNDSASDVFMVRTFETGYASLMSKGFCAPLNENEHIRESVTGMLASIASAVMDGGDVLGVPVDVDFDWWAALECSVETLEQCGITPEEIPGNLLDLLDMLITWYENGALDGVRLFDQEQDRQTFALIWFTLNHYTCYYSAANEWLDYDTPLFKALMEKCDRLSDLMEAHASDANGFLFRYASPDLLLSDRGGANTAFMPLTPQAGMAQCYPVYLTVATMNPLSQNKQAALAYLAAILDELPALTRLYLWPDTTMPTKWAGYEEERRAAVDEAARLQAIVSDNSLDADERSGAEERLSSTTEWLAYLDSDAQWELSPQTIAAYQGFAHSIVVTDSAVREMLDEPMIDLVERYASGQIEPAAFMDALIRKARLIRMEQN